MDAFKIHVCEAVNNTVEQICVLTYSWKPEELELQCATTNRKPKENRTRNGLNWTRAASCIVGALNVYHMYITFGSGLFNKYAVEKSKNVQSSYIAEETEEHEESS